jgi:hypothetical protein
MCIPSAIERPANSNPEPTMRSAPLATLGSMANCASAALSRRRNPTIMLARGLPTARSASSVGVSQPHLPLGFHPKANERQTDFHSSKNGVGYATARVVLAVLVPTSLPLSRRRARAYLILSDRTSKVGLGPP